jgi:hypothetical protein
MGVVNFTPLTDLPPAKVLQYPLTKKIGGTENQVGTFWKRNKSLASSGNLISIFLSSRPYFSHYIDYASDIRIDGCEIPRILALGKKWR